MWRLRDERGASAVLVAIVLPPLLLGLGALIITVGGWYVARGMDQNAADAAVIAVARTCMEDGGCNPDAADPYVDEVSNGALAGPDPWVCGSADDLPSCSSLGVTEDGVQCPEAHANDYVTVLVTPRNDDGSPTMDNWFSSGDQAVGACAQAALGPPGAGTGVAMTISKCEWEKNTASGTGFAEDGDIPSSYLNTITQRREDDSGDYNLDSGVNFYVDAEIYDPDNPESTYDVTPPAPANAPIAGSETVLSTNGFGAGCDSDSDNSPGNFDWLSKDECEVSLDDPYEGDTGGDPAPCYEDFLESRDSGEPIYIPVYNSVSGEGAGAEYDLAGFAAFVVTGWDIRNGASAGWDDKSLPSTISGEDYCGQVPKGYTAGKGGGNDDICIYGYFTEALVDEGGFTGGGDEDLGLNHAYLTG